MKKYLIVDDAEADVEVLQGMLDKFPLLEAAAVATTLETAISILAIQPIDLVFLDMRLTDQSGLALLRAKVVLPPTIITSAYPEYAVDSYEIGRVADFIVKPFTPDRLLQAVTRALPVSAPMHLTFDEEAIFLKMGRRIQRFNYPAIDYAEAFGIYTKVYVGEQASVVNERLSALLKRLPGRSFVRVHKSYLVNINKIASLDRQNLWVNKTKIPIGFTYRVHLASLLALFDGPDEDAN
ncbi:LytR/AlgR family response regulator transcription factor [uncultured Fibrella sp.]|uniref:LytR/AlgR family response regulator transcription factor n=1 Tax=uncultured Fibrella sp. TaxID=1284596 RepID=UPI0035C953FE